MITPAYVRTMARYNAEMNRRLYDAAAKLTDEQRMANHGAFWGSVHGTLAHLLWGDFQWMSRFSDWPKPTVPIKQSATMFGDFAALRAKREKSDADLIAWADDVDDAWLAGDLTWYSGAAQREMHRPRGFLVAHFFNHQTHHRGQVHALLTAQGLETGDTDLMLIVDPA